MNENYNKNPFNYGEEKIFLCQTVFTAAASTYFRRNTHKITSHHQAGNDCKHEYYIIFIKNHGMSKYPYEQAMLLVNPCKKTP